MSDNVLGINFSDTDPAFSVNVKEILRGYEGYSPTVTVEDVEGGHKVIITDKTGEHEFTVLDGDSITAESIINALGYTPADAEDLSDKQDVIADLNDIRHGAELGATALQDVPATYRTAAQQDAIHDAMKQDVISDLSTIRSGAAAGATALQEVPATYRTAAEQDKIHDDAKADQTALETEISDRKAADETLTANVDSATSLAQEAKDGLSTKQDTLTDDDKQAIADLHDDAVDDVQINGTSILADGVANVPLAKTWSGNDTIVGVVAPSIAYGLYMLDAKGRIGVYPAEGSNINSRNSARPITPSNLDNAVKAALCDGKGAAWSSTEQSAALARLGLTVDSEGIVHFA